MAENRVDTLTSDVWAEELISRLLQASYHAQHNDTVFSRELKVGRLISISGAFKRSYIDLRYSNTATEHTDRAASKLWSDKLRAAEGILTSSGWSIEEGTTSRGREIKMAARLPIEILEKDIDKVVKDLNRAIDQIRLD